VENARIFDIEADELDMFLEEVNQYLQTMEAGILCLEQSPEPASSRARGVLRPLRLQSKGRGIEGQTAEALDDTFYAAHSLKGIAGAVGHHQMAELTHILEALFDQLRQGGLLPSHAMANELLVTVDTLRVQRDEVVNQQLSDVDVEAHLARLRALMESGDGSKPARAKTCGEEGPILKRG
jgi:two-component system chemotaxis sensor kinase CheA